MKTDADLVTCIRKFGLTCLIGNASAYMFTLEALGEGFTGLGTGK